jgi:hypothetical protein
MMGSPPPGIQSLPPPDLGQQQQQRGPPESRGVRRAQSSSNLAENAQGQYGGGPEMGRYISTSRSDGQPEGGGGGGGGGYENVQSKFAQGAADAAAQGRAARNARAKRGAKGNKPDRFEEARKEGDRIAAMGRRWQ